MRILVLTREFPPHVVGGMAYHLGYLYSEMAQRGHEVTVLAGVCEQAREAAGDLVDDAISVQPVRYGSFHGHHLRYPLALWRRLRSVDLSRFDVAIAHTQLPYDLPLPTITKYHDCPRAERPFFRREFSLSVKLADSLLDPTRRVVERRSLTRTDHAIFNSERCRQAWADHYTFETPSTVIHNGVDRSMFYPRNPQRDDQYVLFVGDSERKGLSAVRSYARIGSLPVVLVGDTEVPEPNVETLGRVSQERLASLYSDAVATIHPAKFEAFGNVVLESLSCGTPVVTTADCGASELLTPATGVVTDDVAAGVETARDLDSEACVALASDHTWKRVATETLERTRSVLD
ncbi:glycosyltransferase family 4 protein [Haloarcula halophila]|uniref:glycosyltransferase family 4 protein n=1 Tax=Haloarcula TaxID=2237 RepID=UPI0023E3CE82|nr:glycosyltransferase family 4 protein [Halomicroarcula sp. DFY41]